MSEVIRAVFAEFDFQTFIAFHLKQFQFVIIFLDSAPVFLGVAQMIFSLIIFFVNRWEHHNLGW